MVNELLVILGIHPKGSDVFLVLINGYLMFAGADIDASDMRIDD
ncbi:hypothetical protein [Spirosoma foliorum]|nr:hypothetical protein [Spirosoma foliorum]